MNSDGVTLDEITFDDVPEVSFDVPTVSEVDPNQISHFEKAQSIRQSNKTFILTASSSPPNVAGPSIFSQNDIEVNTNANEPSYSLSEILNTLRSTYNLSKTPLCETEELQKRRLPSFCYPACLCGKPTLLDPHLLEERKVLYNLAELSFHNEDPLHVWLLQSLYMQLVKEQVPGRYGHHWDKVGFQGTDPSTDLRCMGLLGLISVHNFALNASLSLHVQKLYELSRSETRGFPFAVLGLNLAAMVFDLTKSEALNKQFQLAGGVLQPYFSLVDAVFVKFSEIWSQEGLTIMQMHSTLTDLRNFIAKHPEELLKTPNESTAIARQL